MSESVTNDSTQKFPLALKVAVAYMILSDVNCILWVLMQPTINPADITVPELEYKADYITAYQIGWNMAAYWPDILFSVVFLLSGIALVRRKAWGRMLGLWALAISTPFDAWSGAVGFAQGAGAAQGYAGAMPTLAMYVGSLVLWSCWHGTWFALLYRKSTVLVLEWARTNTFTDNTVSTAFMQKQESWTQPPETNHPPVSVRGGISPIMFRCFPCVSGSFGLHSTKRIKGGMTN